MIENTLSKKVVVVDDHPLFRRGLVELLNVSHNFQVIADFDDGLEFIDSNFLAEADLLLLDLHMPNVSGIELLKRIRSTLDQSLKVVIITASDDSAELFEAITLGANGYLLKDSTPDEIISQLDAVIVGAIAIASSGVTMLAQHLSDSNHLSRPVRQEDKFELTEREQQTLQLITRGMSNKLIARQLGISDGTVKVYVKNLLRKLNMSSRLELAAWAHNNQTCHSE